MSKDIATIAKEVKQELVKQYPECTWSIRIKRFSGGRELTVSLMSAPFEALREPTKNNGYAQLNQYQFNDTYEGYLNNGAYLTREAWECMSVAYKIANNENWDRSDIQTDYFDVNYWLHMEIGNWDKSFIKTERK